MMMRTHAAFALALGLAFLPSVTHQISFLPIVVLATLLPDIDCARSFLGSHWCFRPVQWFSKHRGVLHSLTFCLLLTGVLALFAPVFALPFFLGYAAHLIADSVTVEGVRIWWPSSYEIRGRIRTGGSVERGIFYALVGICGVLGILLMM